MPFFMVLRTRGSRWQADRPPNEQEAYAPHAALINQWTDQGIAVLGGWLADSGDVLRVMRAASAAELKQWLTEDPWTTLDVLRVTRVEEWSLALGTLNLPAATSLHHPRPSDAGGR